MWTAPCTDGHQSHSSETVENPRLGRWTTANPKGKRETYSPLPVLRGLRLGAAYMVDADEELLDQAHLISVQKSRRNSQETPCAGGVFAHTLFVEATINLTRKIGIEIETVVPIIGCGENFDVQALLAEILTHEGLPAVARSYTHQPVPHDCLFSIEHDASLRDESRYQGLSWSRIEVKTAPMTWHEIERHLPKALDVIRYIGARVNTTCGLHVHHHLPEVVQQPTVVRNLQHLWWRFHPILYGLVAPSRETCHYCVPPTESMAKRFDNVRSFERLRDRLAGYDRYNGVNLANVVDLGRLTVEWRIHGGTTEWSKIKNWVLATQRWTEATSETEDAAVHQNCDDLRHAA